MQPGNRSARLVLVLAMVCGAFGSVHSQQPTASPATPLAIGETFTLASTVLGEKRRINVYTPPPFLLVGIENTVRRRDLTGPTQNAEDRKAAPLAGGSSAFRRFIRTELMPIVASRYRTTSETAIVGESLAGLFVVETFFLEPDLFDSYLAIDPSVWWNDGELVQKAGARLAAWTAKGRSLYFAGSSDDRGNMTKRLGDIFATAAPASLRWVYDAMPEETHGSIYHPAALRAFRRFLK